MYTRRYVRDGTAASWSVLDSGQEQVETVEAGGVVAGSLFNGGNETAIAVDAVETRSEAVSAP